MGKLQAGEVSKLLNTWGRPCHTHVVYVRAITYTCYSGEKTETREFVAPWQLQSLRPNQALSEAPHMSVCLKMTMAQRQDQWRPVAILWPPSYYLMVLGDCSPGLLGESQPHTSQKPSPL